MSILKHHAEWLSLLEISGPFLSLGELNRVFPQGLDTIEPTRAAELRAAYEEWLQDQADGRIHRAWVNYVLGTILGWESRILAENQAIPEGLKYVAQEHGGETVRPTYILHTPDRPDQVQALILIYEPKQDLERAMHKAVWAASPAARMLALLRHTGVHLGLVSNGEQWMLVSAPPDGAVGYISWYAELWNEERLTLRAFASLLGVRRFFGVAPQDSLEAMLAVSASDVQEVTDQLGTQVRHAVEILVRALDRGEQDRGEALLSGMEESRLYEAALTVMMRLVFLLSAEERGLFLLGDPLYDQNYAISTLRAQLHEAADRLGENVLERRFDAWSRLLATFRMVYAGSAHEDLQLPAYGGSLFDPDRFAFLEGRPEGSSWETATANPPAITNRAVLHLLDALQVLQGKGEARRLSFRALDIEQIGHVYEGLLDHEARRAAEPMLGLSGRSEPEVALSALENAKDPVKFLKEVTGRTESTLRRALNAPPDGDRLRHLSTACENDDTLIKRVLPYLNLLRDDELGYPVLILSGHVFVTAGTERRATGTHYTPKALTEPIIQTALEPLIYGGVAAGLPREQWTLILPRDLLELKICDMAMGSGAFLVQACRYLADRLVEGWEGALTPKDALTPNPSPSGRGGSNELNVSGTGRGESKPFGLSGSGGAEANKLESLGSGEQEKERFREMAAKAIKEIARELRHRETPAEEILWEALRDRRLDGLKFRRQHPVANTTFVADFLCYETRLIVELDGTVHAGQEKADAERDAILQDLGYGVQRFPNERIYSDLESVLQEILAAARLQVPLPEAPHDSFDDPQATPSQSLQVPLPEGEGFRVRANAHLSPPTPRLTIYGEAPTGAPGEILIPDDPDERLTLAKRLIAERCLYGVDKNPLAVEMAKLSLWLTTLAKGRPFTFLDHALKCGDSLLGVSLDQLRYWKLNLKRDADGRIQENEQIFGSVLKPFIDHAIEVRRQLESFTVDDINAQREKARLHHESESTLAYLKSTGDHLLAESMGLGTKSILPDIVARFTTFRNAPQGGMTALQDAHLPPVRELTSQPFHWELEFPEVFLSPLPEGEGLGVRAGFHAFVGNPPFQGGSLITGALGVPYRDYLVQTIAEGRRGNSDLCAYFFLRAYRNLRQGGTMGLIATNTIAQGDTREVGLDALVQGGGTIYHALNDQPWIGAAAVVVNVIHLHKGIYGGEKHLDGRTVTQITPLLDDSGAANNPHRLLANEGKSFTGSKVYGMGFILTPEEAAALIAKDPRNQEVLFPYLNGEDLNTHPEQNPSRWIINFFEWEQEQAVQYADCYAILEEKVKPERASNPRPRPRQYWWRYEHSRPELYRTIAPLSRVLVVALVSKYVNMVFKPTDIVFMHKLGVLPFEESKYFALLQSSFHSDWAWKYSSTLGSGTINYSPTDCFGTFPFPESLTSLETIGEQYHETRRQIMLQRQEGLTTTYNRFHHPGEKSADIQALRDLHVAMDQAVAAAYGWDDLVLGHGFHETKQGLRFTIQESARREVLKRLLALNLARYEAEQSLLAGLPKPQKGKGKPSRPAAPEPLDPNAPPPEQLDLWDDGTPKQGRLL